MDCRARCGSRYSRRLLSRGSRHHGKIRRHRQRRSCRRAPAGARSGHREVDRSRRRDRARLPATDCRTSPRDRGCDARAARRGSRGRQERETGGGRPEDDQRRQLVGAPRAGDEPHRGRYRSRRAAHVRCTRAARAPSRHDRAERRGRQFRAVHIAARSVREAAAHPNRVVGQRRWRRSPRARLARPSSTTCAPACASWTTISDRLDKASADDWWDVTRARVADYIDRVEKSVARLDDNPASTAPPRGAAPKDTTPR